MELQKYQNVYFFDSNVNIIYEMFSSSTGQVNNIFYLQNIFQTVMKQIHFDFESFPLTTSPADSDVAIESNSRSDNNTSDHLFRN